MPKFLYLGPSDTFNGKPVPPEGLEVTLTQAERDALPYWHQFADQEGVVEQRPTPQELNERANREAARSARGSKPADVPAS